MFINSDNRYNWVVSLSRSIELTRSGSIVHGVLLVDMNFSGIEQICKNVDLGESGYLYLIDSNGEIIYHPRQQLIYSDLLHENNRQAAEYEDGTHTETFEGQQRLVTVKTVGVYGLAHCSAWCPCRTLRTTIANSRCFRCSLSVLPSFF